MNFVKRLLHPYATDVRCVLFLFLFATSSMSYADFRLIPFDQFNNVQMLPNDMVATNYAFGNHAIIFCFDNTLQTFSAITWPFQLILHTSQLPLQLKTKKEFAGEFADPVGTIYVSNFTPILRVVSCKFSF